MIEVKRSKFDNTIVVLSFPYCLYFGDEIKKCGIHSYNRNDYTWSIKKGMLKILCDHIGIYNFIFEDAELRKIAEGNAGKFEKDIMRNDHLSQIKIWTNIYNPEYMTLSFIKNPYYHEILDHIPDSYYQENGNLEQWLIYETYIPTLVYAVGSYNLNFADSVVRDRVLALSKQCMDHNHRMTVTRADDESVILRNVQDPFLQNMILTELDGIAGQRPDEYRIQGSRLPLLIRKSNIVRYEFGDAMLEEIARGFDADEKTPEEVKNRLSDFKLDYPVSFKTKPLPHQLEAVKFGIEHPVCLIADEQGLGKTMEAINIAVYRKQQNQVRKCLIVCGVNSTKYNWAEEIEKHSDEKCVIFDQSSSSKKMKAVDEWKNNDVFFGIVNIESLRAKKTDTSVDGKKKNKFQYLKGWCTPADLPESALEKELNKIADMVIFDEIHKAKSADSRQGIAMRQLTQPYKIGLSGTPMTNKMDDLWNILSWFGKMKLSYYKFIQKYCIMGGYEDRQIVGYRHIEDIIFSLRDVMIRRTKNTVLDLPDKIYQSEYVELTPSARKRYTEALDGIVSKTIIQTDDGFQLKEEKSDIGLVQLLKLRQITGGLNIDDIVEIGEKDNTKLIRIKEMLDEEIIPNGHKAIIFSSWENVTAVYRERLRDYNPAYIVGDISPKMRQEEVNRFQNDPDCRIIIGTIGAMGTGLTLTAASYVFFVDKAWNQVDNEQAEDRAHRIGTKGNVTIISMLAKNTIDEKVEKILQQKKALFNAVIEGRLSDQADIDDAIAIKMLLEK